VIRRRAATAIGAVTERKWNEVGGQPPAFFLACGPADPVPCPTPHKSAIRVSVTLKTVEKQRIERTPAALQVVNGQFLHLFDRLLLPVPAPAS